MRHACSPDWCPNGAFAGFEKAQIGRGGGKALSDTGWHWLCTPAPVLVLLGFCDFGRFHAAAQREGLAVLFGQEPALASVAQAANPVKQGICPSGRDRRGDTDGHWLGTPAPVIDFIGFFWLTRHRATLHGIGVQVVRRSSLGKTAAHAPFAGKRRKSGRHRGANPLTASASQCHSVPPRRPQDHDYLDKPANLRVMTRAVKGG